MTEYDIGDLVFYIDRRGPRELTNIGVICDKREDDGQIRYSIDWADGYRDDNYSEREVEVYVNNATKIA
jgi:hypothetical protein